MHISLTKSQLQRDLEKGLARSQVGSSIELQGDSPARAAEPKETTPLRGHAPTRRTSVLFTIPYSLTLLCCLLCNAGPFLPVTDAWVAHFSLDPTRAQLALLVAPDYMQDILWPSTEQMLDNVAFVSLRNLPNRRPIRKSDSVNAMIKGIALKIIPACITTCLALTQSGLPLVLALFVTLVGQILYGWVTFTIFTPLATEIEMRKSRRDDDLYVFSVFFAATAKLINFSEANKPDADETQERYTASSKLRGIIYMCWKASLLIGTVAVFLFGPPGRNTALWARLGHQVYAIDETWHKIWQSLTKARRISAACSQSGGIVCNLVKACERTWKAKPMRLDEVPGLEWAAALLSCQIGYVSARRV